MKKGTTTAPPTTDRNAVQLARAVKTLRARWRRDDPDGWAEFETKYQCWTHIDNLVRAVLFFNQPTLFEGGTDDGTPG